ncbi:MAG TPA: FAD-dependent oxidoreductase [Chitinophagaceae bacterium]|nr:FAD-dependent oxidoreductase [Chitinophagaceae bacterium]
MAEKRNIVIIGNGIAGITCARNIRKRSKDSITIISSESKHFFSRTALMYVYMGHMKYENIKPYEDWFWEKNNFRLIQNHVAKVDTNSKFLELTNGDIIRYDILIIASGSKTKKYGWPGQDLEGVTGLYSLQDLEAITKVTAKINNAVVVGGGLIGVELAEMLHSKKIHVTFLVREKNFWDGVLPSAEATMVGNHIAQHGIKLLYETELKEITESDDGKVRSVITNKGTEIPCGFVGITTGVEPNIDFLEDSDIETDRGVLIDKHFETTVSGVYAIGDCAQFINPVNNRKAIEQVWYTARMHGETLAQTLYGKTTPYNPGPWFNSAKFFDIEYQTYGDVYPKLSKDEKQFFWKHPVKEILIRFAWNGVSNVCIGVNSFGIRLRHELFDKWLSEKQTIQYIIDHLHLANFDPEFFERHEKNIREAFYMEHPISESKKEKVI